MTTPQTPRQAAAAALEQRLNEQAATVAVLGLGYVGLPLLHAVAQAGFHALGIDRDPTKIERLRAGENYLPHLGDDLARRLGAGPRVTLTTDRAQLAHADAILICVPTPLDHRRTPDLTAVEAAARDVYTHAVAEQPHRPRLVVLESTTYPGTTRGVVMPLASGNAPAKGPARAADLPQHHNAHALFAAFSPEREDPGRRDITTRRIPKLVAGLDEHAHRLALALYRHLVDTPVPVATVEEAEAAKLVENVYRSVNIALVNELKTLFTTMGIDVWRVLDAAETKPFGFHRFNPGPGFGGHCVPIDPFYLSWCARAFNAESRFIELAGEINHAMPAWVVDRCAHALRSNDGPALREASLLILGLAYKKNVGDVRESPSFELIELLKQQGARVAYHDPFVPRTWAGRRHDVDMTSVDWSAQTLAAHDAVLIATDHDWYDWDFVLEHARLIVDTRNAAEHAGPGARQRFAHKVVKA